MKRTALTLKLIVMALLVPLAAYRFLIADSAAHDGQAVADVQSRIAIPAAAPDGTPITQLSALAWDPDEQLLYALSDRGILFHFRLTWEGSKLTAAEPVHAAPVAIAGRTEGEGRGVDTEDMVLVNHDNGRKGDSELYAVTEREPRFLHMKPTGVVLRELAVPPPLDEVANFQKANQGLEAVVMHPEHGLLTTAEAPLQNERTDMHTLYGKEGRWMFKRHADDARLKAMVLLESGDLLVLERSRSATSKLKIASIQQVSLHDCKSGRICRSEEKLKLPEERSNFEGLTHLKDGLFLLVNDHNGKDGQGGTLLLVKMP